MNFVFHQEDWWTWNCLRTFRKPATVRHQKRIHDVLRIGREIRMCQFFLDHAVPFMCSEGIMNSDTIPNIVKYWTTSACELSRLNDLLTSFQLQRRLVVLRYNPEPEPPKKQTAEQAQAVAVQEKDPTSAWHTQHPVQRRS